MNKEEKIDYLIKDALSQSDIHITDKIDSMIEETLEKLPVRKLQNKKIQFKKVAALIVAAIISMGTISYAATGEIPIVKDIIKRLENNYTINPKFKEYIDMSSSYTIKDSGVAVSFLGAMSDDYEFTLILKIQYDEDVKTKITNIVEDSLIINDKEIKMSGGTYDTQKIDNNTFIKIISKKYKDKNAEGYIPSKFNYEYKIGGFTGVKGSWNVKGYIDNTKLVEDTFTKKINEKISTPECVFDIDKFTINPIEAIINYKYKESEEYLWSNQKKYFLLQSFIMIDENNKNYLPIDGSGESNEEQGMNSYLKFYKNESMPKSITLIPMVEIHLTDSKTDDNVYKALKPQKLDFGELGSVNIKKVEKENGEIRITATKEGIAPLNKYIVLKGDKFKDTLFCENIKEIFSENKDEFTMVFKGAKSFQKYNIVYSQPYKLNIYRDKAITIKVGK